MVAVGLEPKPCILCFPVFFNNFKVVQKLRRSWILLRTANIFQSLCLEEVGIFSMCTNHRVGMNTVLHSVFSPFQKLICQIRNTELDLHRTLPIQHRAVPSSNNSYVQLHASLCTTFPAIVLHVIKEQLLCIRVPYSHCTFVFFRLGSPRRGAQSDSKFPDFIVLQNFLARKS